MGGAGGEGSAGHDEGLDVGRVLVGCSGWSYDDWRGRVYPSTLARSRWLAAYAERFGTVELNASFYRLPTATAVATWAAAVPAGFVFALKLGAFGSHRMKLRDPDRWLARHLGMTEGFGSHLGPTLVQLPPRWHRDTARLDAFLAATPAGSRWAVELRDPSWVHDDTFAVLERHGAALCLHDLLPDHPVVLTTEWTYVRFHGPDARRLPYHGRYGPDRLAAWADRLGRWRAEGIDAYAYFNNDVAAAAVEDASWLQRALSTSGGAPPPGTPP